MSCLPHDVCEANEVWRDCGRCEKSCNDLTPCESECPQMCVCKDGFSRNDAGDCVEKCCPRLTCDEPRPCPDDMIEVKTPQQVVDGCLVACHQTTCMPKYLEDGAECGSEDEDIPEELRNLECRYPSSCLHADFDFIPVGPRQSPDAPYEPAVCGQYGAGIVVREYLDHVATNGARACDRACTDNDECVAWQYEHRGGGRLGYCTLVRSYNEQYPYFSYWWYTAHYVSALKR